MLDNAVTPAVKDGYQRAVPLFLAFCVALSLASTSPAAIDMPVDLFKVFRIVFCPLEAGRPSNTKIFDDSVPLYSSLRSFIGMRLNLAVFASHWFRSGPPFPCQPPRPRSLVQNGVGMVAPLGVGLRYGVAGLIPLPYIDMNSQASSSSCWTGPRRPSCGLRDNARPSSFSSLPTLAAYSVLPPQCSLPQCLLQCWILKPLGLGPEGPLRSLRV